MLGIILIVLIALLVVGTIPAWPHSREYGPGPSGVLGVLLVVVIVLFLLGRL
jgi:hypothetical protein